MHELIEPCPHPPSPLLPKSGEGGANEAGESDTSDSPRPGLGEGLGERAEPARPGLVWKTGVILRHGNARAEVIETQIQGKLSIRVAGAQQKTLLDWIRREIYKIHSTYPRIQVEEQIPCNCAKCEGQQTPVLYPLSILQQFEADKQYEIQCSKSYQMVNVRRLISDVTEPFNPDFPNSPNRQGPMSGKFVQNNSGNAKGYQADVSGGTVYQAENIYINNNNQTQILQLVANLKQIASTFPQEIQDDLIIDIDDIEEELKKSEDKRNPNKLKKRLLALAMAFSAVAAPTAAMADFTNNVTDLAEKAGIELPLPGK